MRDWVAVTLEDGIEISELRAGMGSVDDALTRGDIS